MTVNNCLLCGSSNVTESFDGPFRLLVCKNCELQWIGDLEKHLSDRWFDNYYSRRKDDLASKSNEKREEQYEIDSSFLKIYLRDGDSVLDVGCSYGKFLQSISALRDNLTCTGIDIDGSAISEAKAKFGELSRYKAANLLSIDEKNEFDLVTFRGTLQYHGADLPANLSQLRQILKPSGKVVIFSLPSTDAFMYKLLGRKWALFHPEMQLMFNERVIRFMAQKFGFCIEDLQYPYLEDVYANPSEDYDNVRDIILGKSEKSNPFWGSIMRIVLSKTS